METGKVAKAEKAEKESNDSEFDFTKSVAKLVNTLAEEERRVALVTGEATMWIYKLYSENENSLNGEKVFEAIEQKCPAAMRVYDKYIYYSLLLLLSYYYNLFLY